MTSIKKMTIAAPTTAEITMNGSSQPALAAATDRAWALFINDSDAAMYLMLGATAVANTGIRLNAHGGSFEMSLALGNLYAGVVNVIGTALDVLLVNSADFA